MYLLTSRRPPVVLQEIVREELCRIRRLRSAERDKAGRECGREGLRHVLLRLLRGGERLDQPVGKEELELAEGRDGKSVIVARANTAKLAARSLASIELARENASGLITASVRLIDGEFSARTSNRVRANLQQLPSLVGSNSLSCARGTRNVSTATRPT